MAETEDLFDAKLNAIEAPVTQLFVSQRQHSRVIRMLAVSLVFDILLSLGLGFVAFKTRSDVTARAKATCEAGNEFRRLDLERWNFIINLSTPKEQTPEQARQSAVFKSFIDQADAQKQC